MRELHDLYSLPISIIGDELKNEMGGASGTWERSGKEDVHIMFWRVNLRKESLGRPRRRGNDNIKMVLQEIGCGHGMV